MPQTHAGLTVPEAVPYHSEPTLPELRWEESVAGRYAVFDTIGLQHPDEFAPESRISRVVPAIDMDTSAGDDVVVRYYHEKNPLGRERVTNGLRAQAAVSGVPGVMPLRDAGVFHELGEPHRFSVEPFMTGQNLLEKFRNEGPLEEADLVKGALSLLPGLQAMKKQDILHRDVKPSNIIEDEAGNWWLTDFGVATTVDQAQNDRQAGTLQYMAPENFLSHLPMSHRLDMYSLGVTLRLGATGHLPIQAAGKSTAFWEPAILYQNPLKTAELRPDLSPALAHVIDRLLAKDPAERLDADQVAARLAPLAVQHSVDELTTH